MSATTIPHVQVPCPVCGHAFDWPPTQPCARCHADLGGPVAAAYWQLARESADLQARQEALRQQLAATASPPTPVPAPPPPAGARRPRLTDLGAQTLLGLAGAALLAVAAVIFAAVTWQDLPSTARATILVAAAGGAVGLALWLHRRLPVTAGAVAMLADALVGTVVWAAHTYGATGDLVDTGGGALAALAAALTALVLGGRQLRWQPVAAAATWVATCVLAALAVVDVAPIATVPTVVLAAAVVAAVPAVRLPGGSTPRGVLVIAGATGLVLAGVAAAVGLANADGAEVAWSVLAGLGAAGVWLAVGGRVIGTVAATAGLTGLGIGALATLDLELAPLMAGVAGIVAVVAGAAAAVGTRRVPILVGALPVAVPTVVWTGGSVSVTVDAWGRHLGSPWGTAPVVTTPEPWIGAMALLTAGAVVVAVRAQWPSRGRTTLAVALPVAAATAAWHLGASTWVLVAVAAWVAGGGLLRVDGTTGRASFAAGAVVAAGWALPSPMLSTLAAGAGAVAALSARTAPVGRHAEQSALAVVLAATAAAGATVWALGTADAATVAGPIAVGLAVLVALVDHRLGADGRVSAVALTVVGVVATTASTIVESPGAGARTSAVLAAGALALAVVCRADLLASGLHAGLAILAATATSSLLLADAGVTTPEAYTAVPAALALGAGAVWMHREPTARSWVALQPGLALAFGPTLLLLVIDTQDTTRALAAAVLAAVALLVGTARRIAAPLAHGAAAVAVVVVTQLVVVAGHLPRWLVYATLGALLVAASAAFERLRAEARHVRDQVRQRAATYR